MPMTPRKRIIVDVLDYGYVVTTWAPISDTSLREMSDDPEGHASASCYENTYGLADALDRAIANLKWTFVQKYREELKQSRISAAKRIADKTGLEESRVGDVLQLFIGWD